MIETVYYWPDGTWCVEEELEEMTHMGDDYASFDCEGLNAYDIGNEVRRLLEERT